MLHRITGGTPRLINIVASKAMMLAYGEGRQQVVAKHVRDAAADTPEVRRDWLPWVMVLSVAVVIAVLAIFWMRLG
jgi:MSHA biogenesis protein MshM